MVLGLAIGILAGLLIACLILVIFKGTTPVEFWNKLTSASFKNIADAVAVGIGSFVISLIILVTVHEAGHLVFGILSGYRFVSFRIFNFTFIKVEGKIKVKRFSIAGTGGQCLLTPPDVPYTELPTVLYNIGGILANIIFLLPVLPLFWIDVHPLVRLFALIYTLTDIFLILVNGIPMRIGGAGNDGSNLLLLRSNIAARKAMAIQLRSNAMIQNGIRPKDMPEEYFISPGDINYRNAIEAAIPIMSASRLIDEGKYEEALEEFENLYLHKDEIMPLYVKEIECELVFLRLITGNPAGAQELLTQSLRQYIDTYRKMMSSKERILSAIYLYLDNDKEKAVMTFRELEKNAGKYLLQGEVKSDIAILQDTVMK